jgi:uncharacterized protein YjaG (DUF416 family)
MTILRFDETQLVRNLEQLSPLIRVVFAAMCAERLRPAYLAFSTLTGRGEPAEFEAILDRLWDDVDGKLMTNDEIDIKIERCMGIIPQEDEGIWVDEQAHAEDAATALTYVLRCRQSGQSQEAAWAARCVYETLDHYVISQDNVDVSVSGAEIRVLSHPLIQAELARQHLDLEEMGSIDATGMRQAAAKLRERARSDSAHVFSSTS